MKPMRKTPLPATERSFENAMMLTPVSWARDAMARTEAENNGPRISSAPSIRAASMASAAPSGVPAVSLG